jgi:hypothetical protein
VNAAISDMSGSVFTKGSETGKATKENEMDTAPWDDMPTLAQKRGKVNDEQKKVRQALEKGNATTPLGASSKGKSTKASKSPKKKASGACLISRRRSATNIHSPVALCPSSACAADR